MDIQKYFVRELAKVIRTLPYTHTLGNPKLKRFQLIMDGGGTYDFGKGNVQIGFFEFYSPSLHRVIRHEIGHAVHAKNFKRVNEWLQSRFGWQSFPPTRKGIDEWVKLMGGWGDITEQEKREVCGIIKQCLGEGYSWEPPKFPKVPKGHPWFRPWFAPRMVVQNTKETWYKTNYQWYRIGSRAFFLDYYYAGLVTVNTSTLDFINNHMPDTYAAVAPIEFFAELYNMYFDPKNRNKENIPADVRAWLKKLD